MNFKEVKTFEDACNVLGQDASILPDVSMLEKSIGNYIVDIFKLTTIVKAINPKGWMADYGNHDQYKYYPWFYIDEGHRPGSAGGFSYGVYDDVIACSDVGSRLVFSDRERAAYAGSQFLDLYERLQLIFE